MASAVASLGLAPSDDASPAMMEEVEFVVASLVEVVDLLCWVVVSSVVIPSARSHRVFLCVSFLP